MDTHFTGGETKVSRNQVAGLECDLTTPYPALFHSCSLVREAQGEILDSMLKEAIFLNRSMKAPGISGCIVKRKHLLSPPQTLQIFKVLQPRPLPFPPTPLACFPNGQLVPCRRNQQSVGGRDDHSPHRRAVVHASFWMMYEFLLFLSCLLSI